ncbi:MAG: hypothetical protein R2710_25925 [Acidimicrobiales bacterium]
MSVTSIHPKAAANRAAKARRLAAILIEHGATRASATGLPAASWAHVAELDAIRTGGSFRAPSAATIAETLLHLPLTVAEQAAAYADAEQLLEAA